MIGIRKPVRLGAHLRHHAALLQREHRVDRSRGDEKALDLLHPLAYAVVWDARRTTLSWTPCADATLRTNDAPARVGVRTSRCGERGPESDPPPRKAPRR